MLKLYFLQASRSIRIAWLLEELELEYDLFCYPRENKKAPLAFKKESGSTLGKAPVLWDGDLMITESGNITEYLCETYDKDHRLLPIDPKQRNLCRQWIHAAEGTFMIHALAITYARWNLPSPAKDDGQTLQEMEKGLSVNVQKDLDWLEGELASGGGGPFLLGHQITSADTMLFFSIDFILQRGLGTHGRKWPKIEAWLDQCKTSNGYKRAVERTGHQM